QSTGIVGVWDDVTGTFEGDFQIPPRATTLDVTDPAPATISLIVHMDAEPVVGNIDPVSGEVSLATIIDVTLEFQTLELPPNPAGALNMDCIMEDIDVEFSSSPDGEPFDPNVDPPTFAVT